MCLLRRTLTTGEKNGCIYTLCFKTFVFNRCIKLGIGRVFQIRFSRLVIWAYDNVVAIGLCCYRCCSFDLAVHLDIWRQTNVRMSSFPPRLDIIINSPPLGERARRAREVNRPTVCVIASAAWQIT